MKREQAATVVQAASRRELAPTREMGATPAPPLATLGERATADLHAGGAMRSSPPCWPNYPAVLAAVKDEPFGWRYAPSLTAAAHGENGPPCRNEGMDRARQAPSAPSPIASGPPKVPGQKPDGALKLRGRPRGENEPPG